MIPRILEPEVMDSESEAVDYNTMDHSQVNRVFVDDLLAALSQKRDGSRTEPWQILDVGTGTALIPIELCRRPPGCWHVTAADLAQSMLNVAALNIAAAGLGTKIKPQLLDAKELPFGDGHFDVVMTNSILHHIPDPRDCFGEMVRVVAPGGLLFVRDLLRPESKSELDRLVDSYAGDANASQREMFAASLHAALTLAEVRQLIAPFGLSADCAKQTTDRHWTVSWHASV
jgi:ubiquinone/menaquinone biosynthesis C-methylase UbiE